MSYFISVLNIAAGAIVGLFLFTVALMVASFIAALFFGWLWDRKWKL